VRRHPIFARFYERLSRATDRIEREYRQELAGPARGRVLEIGVGNGLNLEHYRDAELVVAADPEPSMLALAGPRARAAAVPVRLIRARAERLPFLDASFDTAVCSLVLCSVEDPGRSVEEIRRVLRPGGALRFWEHVRSFGRAAGRVQDVIAPAWGLFSGGCHPNRDTLSTIRRAGFEVEARPFPLGPPSPVRPQVLGTAIATGGGRPDPGAT
jgi:SAM-dependent methyltransferase